MDPQQALLAEVLDVIAQKFAERAVLRGGMVLRMLGSARSTNDLDYVFVPYASKKEIVGELVDCLESIDGAVVEHSLHSKCLRVSVTVDRVTIQVEASVAQQVSTSTLTTKLFSPLFDLPQRIIPVVDYSVAMANKMAAWNERRLVRDLYDIWFYLQMKIEPHEETLRARLKAPDYSKLVRKEDYFSGATPAEFYEFLRERASKLTDANIAAEMADSLPPEDLSGLGMLFRAALANLR